MPAFFRAIAFTVALLSSSTLQIAAASVGGETCCSDDADRREAPGPVCQLGFSCGCCAPANALAAANGGLSRSQPLTSVAGTCAREPVLAAPLTGIFHPPRA